MLDKGLPEARKTWMQDPNPIVAAHQLPHDADEVLSKIGHLAHEQSQ